MNIPSRFVEDELVRRALESEEARKELYDYAHALALTIAKEYETKEHSAEKIAKFSLAHFHKMLYAYVRRTLTEHGKDDKFSLYLEWWIRKTIEKDFQLEMRGDNP